MVIDHGTKFPMDSMPISKFKATCLATMERVRKTGQPLRVTRFGKPVVDIVPTAPEPKERSWIGAWRDEIEICGDIVSPIVDESEWEVLK